MPLRTGLAVHTRLLVSVPLLYWADVVLHELCALAIEDFTERRVAVSDRRERLPEDLAPGRAPAGLCGGRARLPRATTRSALTDAGPHQCQAVAWSRNSTVPSPTSAHRQ
jgi:hypothetical protein